MIGSSLTRVLVERERLRARAESQRTDLARYTAGLGKPIALVDGLIQGGRFVRSHPAIVLAGVAAFGILRGRRLLGLVTRGFAVWRLVRRARVLLRAFGY